MNFDFPAFLVLASILTGGIWLLDALVFAPRRRRRAGDDAKTAREPVLVEYARSFFPVIFAVLILRSFLVEPFRIPSNSMMPTLLTGDFILVNKYAYGLRWPVLNQTFIEIGDPRRGDVIVFKFPLDESTDYIKRVVAVPGDRLSYENKTLIVNGEPVPQLPVGRYQGVGAGFEMTGARESLERLNDRVEHRILTRAEAANLPPGCRVLSHGPIEIPPDHYFVMGDNRDNSNDSRCWGLVPKENLVGRAFAIWMHWDGRREGFPIDGSRLFNAIH